MFIVNYFNEKITRSFASKKLKRSLSVFVIDLAAVFVLFFFKYNKRLEDARVKRQCEGSDTLEQIVLSIFFQFFLLTRTYKVYEQ